MSDTDSVDLITRQPIRKDTVVGQVMERVKALIASGVYRPGDRLPTEQELAEMFQVGRSSIREALKVFHYLGVVESKAAKGTFIQKRANISLEAITWALVLGKDDLHDVYELRTAIESSSFRHFVEDLAIGGDRATTALKHLKAIIDRMYHFAAKDDAVAMANADFAFHECIIDAGGNTLFGDMYRTLQAFMHNEIMLTYRNIDHLAAIADDHAQILEVIENGGIEQAIDRHREHFQRTLRLLGLQTDDRPG